MINENKELIITTVDAFEVIRIINKLNMKDSIANAIEDFVRLDNQKKSNTLELRKILIEKMGGNENYLEINDDEKQKNTEMALLENPSLKENMIRVNSDMSKLGMELIYEFIVKLPMAEKEIYKCLAKIFNKQVKEVENQELDVMFEQIKLIVRSRSVLGFFNLATK